MTSDPSSPHATTFLFSSTNPPPESFFQGYLFADTDYVFSDAGKRDYEASTGIQIKGGLDGCYAITRKDGDRFVFSNDFAGYKTLFYYHDGDTWAVGNSFTQIVEFLRSAGVTITPNYAQLAAINAKGSPRNQIFSFNTTVQGVKLLPRATDLIVSEDDIRVERWLPVPDMDYAAGLREHLDLWVGRFESLLMDERVGLTADLTGGVDSRTNFALLTMAKRRLGGRGGEARLNCASSAGNTKDLDVATQLTEHFGVPLNDGRRFIRRRLSPEESFETFHNLQVGVAHTLYWPGEAPTPFKVSISGGGGEIHRRFYERQRVKAFDSEAFVRVSGERLHYPWLIPDFLQQGHAALEYTTPAGKDPLRAHYREFRHRFHVGRAPRYGVAFTPLDSRTADLTQSQAGKDRLDAGQFNYDVIASLSSDLLDLPYDEGYKAPSDEVRSRLTTVEVPRDARPGKVWAPETIPSTAAGDAIKRAAILRDAVETAIADPFVASFWGQGVIDEARGLLGKLAAGESIGNAVNGVPISALLAAHVSSPTV